MTDRSIAGRIGAHMSWARTVDRSARTANARRSGPGEVDWHLARLGPQFDDATAAQRLAAAESARKAYFAALALKSAKSRPRR
ncbi:MAG: hypothetical protein AB7L17_04450 [Ilumatobacteraceae bacterium]